jgi:prolyl oligopeptidase
MKTIIILVWFLLEHIFFIMNSHAQEFTVIPTTKNTVKEYIHGIELTDHFRWLEDKNQTDVIDWTRKQHDATVDFIKKTAPDIPGLDEEIKALFDREMSSPPRLKKDREFISKKKKGELQFSLYTIFNGEEIKIFDPVLLDPSGKTSITSITYNKNASKAAIGTQSKGAEITDIRIIDTKTGKQIGETLSGIGSFSWAKDESKAFITPRTKELIDKQSPLAVYLHTIGQNPASAQKLVEPSDAKISAWIYETEYEDFQVWGEGDFYTNTIKFRTIQSNENPKIIYSSKEYKAYPEFRNNDIYWMTNDNAPNFKVMKSNVNSPEFATATTLIPEGETVIDGFEITNSWIIVQDKKDIMTRLKVYDLQGNYHKELELPEFGNVSAMSYDRDKNLLYITISTFTAPAKMYKVDGNSLNWTFYYQESVPVDLSDITADIHFYESKDNKRIPMFIVHKKDLQLDGNNPVLITGYGGFNIGISPSFVGYNASFLKRGGIWVSTGLRGGNEYGESWHQDGMLKKKQHTFDDFIAATEWLIKNKYTNPSKIVARGGSNGGLLMGAIATQRPD